MMAATAQFKAHNGAPDLSDFRKRFPLTVASFGALAEREAWLRRIWELDARWERAMERAGDEAREEIVVHEAPPRHLTVEAEYEIIYAGGVLGLLHAAVMNGRYNRRVMVFDAHAVGRTHRDWNISDEELKEFERAGLFTKEEIEAAIANRYRSGFVKFHDAASRVKTPPLWIDGVLDVAVEADKLLQLAAAKIEQSHNGSVLMDGLRLVRCYAQPSRVTVEVEETRTGRRRLFGARLLVDATGTNSSISRQLNDGRALTHVCPTVGTVARGFVRGEEPNQVDFSVGEILVSNQDAQDHRQLIWEGFAGNRLRDEYTTYLFFYDAVNSPADKSLLALFERYFETLPGYKRAGTRWRVLKPVFGYIPSFHHQGWGNRKRTAENRLMLIGDSAGLSSPLTFCGFGSHVRNLRRLTHLTELALAADMLDQAALSEVNAYEPRVAQMASFAEFLRPTAKSEPAAVNETLNAVMAALHGLDERVRRELFQDRMSFSALKNLLSQTARLYPRIFTRVREHLGARGTFWWLANIASAAFSERRALRSIGDTTEPEADAAQAFAHHLRLYKNRQGAGSQP
ncbi:MAG: lycopene cyclase CruA [Blastocatellia bacterium]|jgi:lycopene cyclase CruA|nr:lycopene cyclase CruA [Blastocatellia bacterium]